jgi:predicted phosphodiesterase
VITASGWVDWLAELPPESRTVLPDGTRVLCVHARPGSDEAPGIHPRVSEEVLGAAAAECDADLVFSGHTHWPWEVSVNSVQLVNVGSVSNPFPADLRAGYVLLEAKESDYNLQHRRVAYDREAVGRELQRVKHPAARYIIGHMRGEHLPYWR